MSGTLLMLQYSETPGLAGSPPAGWPESSAVPPPHGCPALLMFVHPQCPCSQASVGELERLVASCPGQFRATVLFLKPDGTTDDWVKTGLWDRAEAIPGVTVLSDGDGNEARRFHAGTSGQTMLYDSEGTLLFNGGITPARGHSGDNAGSAAVASLLGHPLSSPVKTPVFGCALNEIECRQETASCKP
jgi:hypothetical protein